MTELGLDQLVIGARDFWDSPAIAQSILCGARGAHLPTPLQIPDDFVHNAVCAARAAADDGSASPRPPPESIALCITLYISKSSGILLFAPFGHAYVNISTVSCLNPLILFVHCVLPRVCLISLAHACLKH